MDRTPEEWDRFLHEHEATMKELGEIVGARPNGQREPWTAQLCPFTAIAAEISHLFEVAVVQPNLSDYTCRFESDGTILRIKHFQGVSEVLLGTHPEPWLGTTKGGAVVYLSERYIEAHPNSPAWRQLTWMSGAHEPHRKGDLVYAQGFGPVSWKDESGDSQTAEHPIHYYPMRYKGYAHGSERVCRGEPADAKHFPKSIAGLPVLPLTTIEIAINYDQYVQTILDVSGIVAIIEAARVVSV